MKVLAIIPARYDSSRFPGKPLARILDKPMIQHVWERVRACKMIDDVYIATDDERIRDAVELFGGKVRMTGSDHNSGTSRCAEVVSELGKPEIVVNIQGDEPMIDPDLLEAMIIEMRSRPEINILTPISLISSQEEWQNEHIVKVVIGINNKAIYFSRAPVPYFNQPKTVPASNRYKHIGIYMFRHPFLNKVADLRHPVAADERLEQLAWMAHGYELHTILTMYKSIGVDVPEDISRVEHILRAEIIP